MSARRRRMRSILAVGLTALLLAVGGAAPSHAAGPDAESVSRPKIVVLPMGVVGSMPEPIERELVRRVRVALDDEDHDVVIAVPKSRAHSRRGCQEDACWQSLAAHHDAAYLVAVRIEAEEPDYLVQVELRTGTTGASVAFAEERCDLCGREELAELVADLTSTVRRRLVAQAQPPPMLVVTSNPLGARVTLDGTTVGHTPLEMTATPGDHRVQVEAKGHRSQLANVNLVDGVVERVSVRLVPVARTDTQELLPGRPLVIGGAASLGVGLAGIGAGTALLVLHGRPIESECSGDNQDVAGRCRYLHDTRLPGIITTALGGAATIVGVALLAVGSQRNRARTRKAMLVPTLQGFGVIGEF